MAKNHKKQQKNTTVTRKIADNIFKQRQWLNMMKAAVFKGLIR